MTHASVELVEAMRGEYRNDPDIHGGGVACSGNKHEGAQFAWLDGEGNGGRAEDDTCVVTCPVCLLLMRKADPVRWDELEERGLAPKLEAVALGPAEPNPDTDPVAHAEWQTTRDDLAHDFPEGAEP